MFLNHLMIQSVRGENTRQVLNEFIYLDNTFGLIIVPIDFKTDYATIPRFIPRWFINESDHDIREGAVIHDYLYSNQGNNGRITRQECDYLLYQIMRDNGAPWLKAAVVYYSVRLFGGLHWTKQAGAL